VITVDLSIEVTATTFMLLLSSYFTLLFIFIYIRWHQRLKNKKS